MHTWFSTQLDYVYFCYGLAFLLLSIVCFGLVRRRIAAHVPWHYLFAFSFVHGVNEWLDLFSNSGIDFRYFREIRTAFAVTSFIFLFEFGRKGLSHYYKHIPSRTIYFVLFVFAGIMLSLVGPLNANVVGRYVFGLSGTLIAAYYILTIAIREKNSSFCQLRLSALSLAAYSIFSCLVVPPAPFWPAKDINTDSFFLLCGFPVQVLRASCAIFCMFGIWRYSHQSIFREHYNWNINRFLIPTAVVLLVAFGWGVTEWRGHAYELGMRQDVLRHALGMAQAINPEWVKSLSFTKEDLQNPAFHWISEQMIIYGKYMELHGICSEAIRNDRIVFGPESYPPGTADATPPGTPYEEPNEEDWNAFKNGAAAVYGPYEDEYGWYVSAVAPIFDPRSGQVLMVVSVDVKAGNWKRDIAIARLGAILVVMVQVVVLLVGLIVVAGSRQDRWYYRHAEAILTAIVGVSLTIIVTYCVYDIERRKFRERFLEIANARADMIKDSFRNVEQEIHGLSLLFRGVSSLTKKDYESFVDFSKLSPIVQSWAWVPKVRGEEVEHFEQSMTEQWGREVRVNAESSRLPRNNKLSKTDHYPVAYITPTYGNENRLGVDLAVEPITLEAIKRASNAGMPIATKPLYFVKGYSGLSGLMAFAPVIGAISNELKGFLVATLKLQFALDQSLTTGAETDSMVEVHLVDFDARGDNNLLAIYPQMTATQHSQSVDIKHINYYAANTVHPLFIFGRSLTLVIHPTETFLLAQQRWVVLFTGIIGVLLTGLLAGYISSLCSHQMTLEKIIDARTKDLTQTNTLLSSLLNSIPDFVFYKNHDILNKQHLLKNQDLMSQKQFLGHVYVSEILKKINFLDYNHGEAVFV